MAVRDTIAAKALGEVAAARGREIACLALLTLSASCVPSYAAYAPDAPKLAAAHPANPAVPTRATVPVPEEVK